jgi:CubicO group peptidase (beta-lactamase class C family)
MYDFLSGYTLTRDIGAKYEYSNLGMGLLGHALALRAGTSYFDLLRQRILEPLGMKDTRITLTPELQGRLALGHDGRGLVVANWDIPTLAGAGALRSTVNDMFSYLAANLDSTSKPLGRILATTHVSRTATGNSAMTVGLGWHIITGPADTITWHNGGTGGYRSFMGFDRAKGIGVIVLTNSAVGSDDVGLHLLNPAVPLVKPPVERTAVTVAPAVLARYPGVYQLQPDFTLTVTVRGDTLWVEPTGQPNGPVQAESDTVFFVKGADITVTFEIDGTGKVTGLTLRQGGATIPALRIR